MKTLSSSQQQLLHVLRITPLQLNAKFFFEQTDVSSIETKVTDTCSPLQAADLTTALAQDIQLALPAGTSWYIAPHTENTELKDKQLLTPALATLAHAESKKALWRLLSTIDEN